MIAMFIYDEIETEQHAIYMAARNKAAYLTEEMVDITLSNKVIDVKRYFEGNPLLDIACMEITKAGAVPYLEKIRSKYQELFLMVIADETISPMSYMRPGILPSALLLRPCSEADIRRVVEELLEAYINKMDKSDGVNSYVMESKEGKIYIPYHQIYYFESRNKKVYIRTESEEYGFYKTIDALEEELPGFFVRCHRGFIVNTRKIEKVALSQNTIYLHKSMEVPLSRSYKAVIKELGK